MRKPFSSAVDLYRKLEKMSDELVFSALELTPQQILASESCAACFGPQPPNHHVYSDSTQDKLIVCLDGNFQHRHHIKASRDYEPLETPLIFLPSSEFTEMRAIIRAKEIELCPPAKVQILFFCFLFALRQKFLSYPSPLSFRLIDVQIPTRRPMTNVMNRRGRGATTPG
jgi:hypothetical protein